MKKKKPASDDDENHFICQLECHHGNIVGMGVTVQIDKAGRVVLPKRLRERLRLRGGDNLAMEVKGDTIELRPVKPAVRLERINGVLVLVGDIALPERADLVSESRDERIHEIVRGASEPE